MYFSTYPIALLSGDGAPFVQVGLVADDDDLGIAARVLFRERDPLAQTGERLHVGDVVDEARS